MHLTAWRAWRRHHYSNGEPRDDDGLGWLLEHLLSTKRGAIEMVRAERRFAKVCRPQHTPLEDRATDLHAAYGRKHRR